MACFGSLPDLAALYFRQNPLKKFAVTGSFPGKNFCFKFK